MLEAQMNSWEEKWLEDIDFLTENLEKGHNNLFFNINKEEFLKKVKKLKSMINKLDYNEMKVELARLMASIGDGHSNVIFPVNKHLPFKFYIFKEGVYIINATEKYKDLICKKVEAIEDIEIEEVLEGLKEIISYENHQLFKSKASKYLSAAEVLYGLLIIEDMDNIKLKLDSENFNIETISYKELIYDESHLPFYAQNSAENLWYLDRGEEGLYVKYNFCREQQGKKIKEKIKDIIDYIEKNNVEKLTIDFRNNSGGDSTLLEPLIQYIKENKVINRKESLKIIIGRETFSSALLNVYELKNQCNPFIVGEPTGGKPNCYGEILKFTLPNSKFIITYSTKYYKLIEDDSIMFLEPDKIIYENINHYRK